MAVRLNERTSHPAGRTLLCSLKTSKKLINMLFHKKGGQHLQQQQTFEASFKCLKKKRKIGVEQEACRC